MSNDGNYLRATAEIIDGYSRPGRCARLLGIADKLESLELQVQYLTDEKPPVAQETRSEPGDSGDRVVTPISSTKTTN